MAKGGISIKAGRILMNADTDDEIEIDISYVKRDMYRAIKATRRKSIYTQFVREWINQLDNSGLRAIPVIRDRMCVLLGKEKPKGVTMGGGKNTVATNYWERTLASGDNAFLNNKFGITVNKKPKQQKETRHVGMGTEILFRQCLTAWESWLGMIKNFGSSKKKAAEDPNKKYADAYDAAFREPEVKEELQKVG